MTVECTSHNHPSTNDKINSSDISAHNYLKSIVERLGNAWHAFRHRAKQRAKDRKAIKSLEELDDKSLRDIGISRDDLNWVSSLPSEVNASDALNQIRAQNIAKARWNVMHKKIRRR